MPAKTLADLVAADPKAQTFQTTQRTLESLGAPRAVRERVQVQEKAHLDTLSARFTNANTPKEKTPDQLARETLANIRRQDTVARQHFSSTKTAFFTDAQGRVRPITSPEGNKLTKKDNSGVLHDTMTGKAYRMVGNQLVDAWSGVEVTQKKKDGLIIEAPKGGGLPPRAVGVDEVNPPGFKEAKQTINAAETQVEQAATFARERMTEQARRVTNAKDALRTITDIESDPASFGTPEREARTEQARKDVTAAQTELVNRQLEVERAQAEERKFLTEKPARIESERKRLVAEAFTRLPGTGNKASAGNIQLQEVPAKPPVPTVATDVTAPLAAVQAAATASPSPSPASPPQRLAARDFFGREISTPTTPTASPEAVGVPTSVGISGNSQTSAASQQPGTGPSTSSPPKGASQQALAPPQPPPHLNLPKGQSFHGESKVPASYLTPEARTAQAEAQATGQAQFTASPGLRLEGRRVLQTSSPMPGTDQTIDLDVGRMVFDQQGLPSLVLSHPGSAYRSTAGQFTIAGTSLDGDVTSPSFKSGNYFRGIPEYAAPPVIFQEQLQQGPEDVSRFADDEPEDDALAQMERDARMMGRKPGGVKPTDISGMTPEQAMKAGTVSPEEVDAAWQARRWPAAKLNDYLQQWQAGTDADRAHLVADMDPSQEQLAPADRRIDARRLWESGYISLQDARLLQKVAYGIEPDRPSLQEAWSARPDAQTADLATRQAFATEYFRLNRDVVDFSNAGFTTERDAIMQADPGQGAGQWMKSSSANALGSSAGMLVGMPINIIGAGVRTVKSQLKDGMSPEEKAALELDAQRLEAIVGQTGDSAFNLYAQVRERVRQLGGNASRFDEMRQDVNNILSAVDSGKQFTPEAFRAIRQRIMDRAAEINSALDATYTKEELASVYDVGNLDTRAGKVLAEYMETRNPQHKDALIAELLANPLEMSRREGAAALSGAPLDPARAAFWDQVAASYKGGSVAPLTEAGVEYASTMLTFGASRMLGLARKAGVQGARMGAVASRLEEAWKTLGVIQDPKSMLARASNVAVAGAKIATASGAGEGAEEFVSAHQQKDATFTDASAQAAQGAFGGLAMMPIFAAPNVAVAGVRTAATALEARAQRQQQEASLARLVETHNTHNPDRPIDLETARQARGYLSRAHTVSTELAQQATAAMQAVTALPEGPERDAGFSKANDLWMQAFNDQFQQESDAIAAVQEINGLSDQGPEGAALRNVIDAALRAQAGVPLTPEQEGWLANYTTPDGKPVAYRQGSPPKPSAAPQPAGTASQRAVPATSTGSPGPWIFTDAFRQALDEAAPQTGEKYFSIPENDQLELVDRQKLLVDGGRAGGSRAPTPATAAGQETTATLAPESSSPPQQPQGGPVPTGTHNPSPAGSTPAPATSEAVSSPQQALAPSQPASGGYQFSVTYTPKVGGQGQVTATIPLPQAKTPEAAESMRTAKLRALERSATNIQAGPIEVIPQPVPLQRDVSTSVASQPAAPTGGASQQGVALSSNPAVAEALAAGTDGTTTQVPKPQIKLASGFEGWKPKALTSLVANLARTFGYRVTDLGIAVGKDRYGNAVNLGTAWYDKMNPGNEIGQWIDGLKNSGAADRLAENKAAILSEWAGRIAPEILGKLQQPWAHRIFFGHDAATNLPAVLERFGPTAIPSYIGQLFKDSLTNSGIPVPGSQWLTEQGIVPPQALINGKAMYNGTWAQMWSDSASGFGWLSMNIGEMFSGGMALLGTWRLLRDAKAGKLENNKLRTIFATVAIGFKLIGGSLTAQPLLIISGLADTAILVTRLADIKKAFQRITSDTGVSSNGSPEAVGVPTSVGISGTSPSSPATAGSQPAAPTGGASQPAVPVAQSPEERATAAWRSARQRALKKFKVTRDKASAYKAIQFLETELALFAQLFSGGYLLADENHHFDDGTAKGITFKPGDSVAAHRLADGRIALLIDLDGWTAFRGDSKQALRATLLEELYHRAALDTFQPGEMSDFWFRIVNEAPELAKTVWLAYHHVAAHQAGVTPESLTGRSLEDLDAIAPSDPESMGHELLRMLLQDRQKRSAITEVLGHSPGLLATLKQFLTRLAESLRALVAQAPPKLRTDIQRRLSLVQSTLADIVAQAPGKTARTVVPEFKTGPITEPSTKNEAPGTSQPRTFSGPSKIIVPNPAGFPDILDWISARHRIRRPYTKAEIARRKAEGQDIGGEWDWTERHPLDFYHRQVLLGGEGNDTIDSVAQTAFEEGLITQPTADALGEAITGAIDLRKSLTAQQDLQERNMAESERQALDFGRHTAPAAHRQPVDTNDLHVGDEVEVDGEKLKVTDLDPDTGEITLKDGSRFGRQTVAEGHTLYVESYNPRLRSDPSAGTSGATPYAARRRVDDAQRELGGELSSMFQLEGQRPIGPAPRLPQPTAAQIKAAEAVATRLKRLQKERALTTIEQQALEKAERTLGQRFMFEGVRSLPPAQNLTLHAAKRRLERPPVNIDFAPRDTTLAQDEQLSSSTGSNDEIIASIRRAIGSSPPADAALRGPGADTGVLGQVLRHWAQANGRILDNDAFHARLSQAKPIKGGEEHDVFHDGLTDRVVKITVPGKYGAKGLQAWLHNMERSNEVFGDDMQFVGVLEYTPGTVQLVLSQPFVAGAKPGPWSKIAYHLASLGYRQVTDLSFYHPDREEQISDAQEKNILEGEDGQIYPIDVHFLEPSDGAKDRFSNTIYNNIYPNPLDGPNPIKAAPRRIEAVGVPTSVGSVEAPVGQAGRLPQSPDQRAHEAATSPHNDRPEPTDAQKKAGNYKLGHDRIAGMDISFENPAGSTRRGTDRGGKPWSITMLDHYGYFKGSKGKDKDHVDVFVAPGTPRDYEGPVYVVNQRRADGTGFDEHKVILGASSPQEARTRYLSNYSPGWQGLGSIATFPTVDVFKTWLSGDTTRPAVSPTWEPGDTLRPLKSAPRNPDPSSEMDRIQREAQARRQVLTEIERGEFERKAPEHGGFFGGARGLLKDVFAGRLDRLEYYAPGIKKLIESNQFNESYARAAINRMMANVKKDLFAAFGDPKFWSANKKRLNTFLDQILPVAARLEVDGMDDEGNWAFKPFQMRASDIPIRTMYLHNLKEGQDITWTNRQGENEAFVIGPKIPDRDAHVLLRNMPSELQSEIYQRFVTEFPEGVAVLDQFINPDLRDATFLGAGAVPTAVFNRYALLKQFNEWPKELQAIFGNAPIAAIEGIGGYTPDVAAQKTIAAATSSLLNRYQSGGRKFKAGELRESGNVQNLLDGFSTRAMEAHREKIRLKTRRDLIEAAARHPNDVSLGELDNYVPLDDTYDKLYEAVSLAKQLPADRYPALSGALNPQQRSLLTEIVGDLYKLRGSGLVIHRNVVKELRLQLALQRTENTFLKLLEWFLDRFNKGVLDPGSYATNWVSNEIMKLMAITNRLNFTIISGLTGDPAAAKLGAYQFSHLLRGYIGNRFARWQKSITDAIPEELLDDNTSLDVLESNRDLSVLDHYFGYDADTGNPMAIAARALEQRGRFKAAKVAKFMTRRLDPGGAFLKLINYAGPDTNAKLGAIYSMLRGRAAFEASQQGLRGEARKTFIADFVVNAHRDHPAAFHEAYDHAMFWYMDYANSASFLDPSQSESVGSRVLKKSTFVFWKWAHQMLSQLRKMTVGAVGDLLPGHTGTQRREALAKLATLAGLTAVGTFVAGGDDDDDPVLGTSVDGEGNLLEKSLRTGNRLNVSALARKIQKYAASFGVPMPGKDYSWKGPDGSEMDLWVRYRNYPYLREMVILGLALNQRWDTMWSQSLEMFGEYASFGIVTSLPVVSNVNPFNRPKPYPFIATEALYNLAAAPLFPTWGRKTLVSLVDPVDRKDKPLKSWNYNPGVTEAVFANTPGLSRFLPPAGEAESGSFRPFFAAAWYKQEVAKVQGDKKLNPEQRVKQLLKLRAEFKSLPNLSTSEQKSIFERWGMPKDAWRLDLPSTTPVAAKLQQLEQLGVGKEAIRVTDKKTNNSRTGTKTTTPNMGYIDPKSVSIHPRSMQALRLATGMNVKPFRRLTAEEMFQIRKKPTATTATSK